MKPFTIPIIKIVNKQFDMSLMDELFKDDKPVLDSLLIKHVGLNDSNTHVYIDISYNGNDARVAFSTSFDELNPSEAEWHKTLSEPDNVTEKIEEIVTVIAEQFFAFNGYDK